MTEQATGLRFTNSIPHLYYSWNNIFVINTWRDVTKALPWYLPFVFIQPEKSIKMVLAAV